MSTFPASANATPSRRNALKHGLRSAAVLLPGDDVEAFRRLRSDLFREFQPRTRSEAECVLDMAACSWRKERCRMWEAVYDGKLTTLVHGGGGDDAVADRAHCEGDPHRWLHKSLDCSLQETRFDRQMLRARRELTELQRLRRNNLIAGAIEVTTDYREFEREADAALGIAPEPEPEPREDDSAPDAAPVNIEEDSPRLPKPTVFESIGNGDRSAPRPVAYPTDAGERIVGRASLPGPSILQPALRIGRIKNITNGPRNDSMLRPAADSGNRSGKGTPKS